MAVKTCVVADSEPGACDRVVEILRAGGVVALPTDTVYGFSCRAASDTALGRIRRVKRIEHDRGFVALIDSAARLRLMAAPHTDWRVLAFLDSVWPAALTAVIEIRSPVAWGEAVNSKPTAAFRVPASKWLLEVLAQLGEPVLSTSANRSGEPPSARADDLVGAFGSELDLVVRGAHEPRIVQPSTLGCFLQWPPRLLRRGAFDLESALEDFETTGGDPRC